MPAPWEQFQPQQGPQPWTQFQPLAKPADDQSAPSSDGIGRQLGLTARAAITGATGLAGAIADVPVRLANTLGANLPLPSQAQQKLMTNLGLPEPRNKEERFSQAVASSMAGAGTSMGLGGALVNSGNQIAQGVGNALQQAPAMQAVGAATSGAAQNAAEEAGAGPIGQTAAAMAGGMVPFAGQLATAGARNLLRGSDPTEMQGAIRAFQSQGMEPDMGQAANTQLSKGLVGVMPKIPGGAQPMAENAQLQAEQMGQRINYLSDRLVKNSDTQIAGRSIQTGINNFVQAFRNGQASLYGKVDGLIPSDTPIDISNFRNQLSTLTNEIPGLDDVAKILQGSKIQQMQQATENALKGQPAQPGPLVDAQGNPIGGTPAVPPSGNVPWQSVKKVRTLIGQQLDNPTLTDDVGRQQLKQLYGALSQDMGTAAQAAGPDAQAAFNRANWYTQAGHQRIDNFLDNIAGKNTVEGMFQAATGQVKNGGSTVTAVMRSLQPAERNVVTAAFTKRLGQVGADPDAPGSYFSIPTFVTQWKNISPMAKQAIYGDHVGTMGSDLNLISAIGDRIVRASKVGANPSQTSPGITNATGVMGAVAAAATGHLGTAAAILGGMKAAQLTSRMMTNPQFVHWLAKSTTASPAMVPSQINALSDVAAHSGDPAVKQDILRYQQGLQ